MGRRSITGLQTLAVAVVALLTAGCSAYFKEVYFLAAQDPETGVANFYRIQIEGDTSLSRAKYSVGFYDREAVERLFGETSIKRDFLGSQLELFSAENKKDLNDLAEALATINSDRADRLFERIQIATGTVSGLIHRYRTRLSPDPNLAQRWADALSRAEQAEKDATKALQDASPLTATARSDKLAEAEGHVRRAQVILETIRIAVDSAVIVRFFDGAGNELDVTTKTLVIFCASDVSRFAEALRQLAESEESAQNLMLVLLGPKIQEYELAAQRVETSDKQVAELGKKLTALLAEAQKIPGSRDANATEEAKKTARNKESETLRAKVLETAAAIAGKTTGFKSAEEIRGFAAGLGGGQ